MLNLRMTNHGGHCCGMKQIFGFNTNGRDDTNERGYISYKNVTEVPKKYANVNNYTAVDDDTLRDTKYIPPETTAERLDRFLGFMKERQGIIEIILAESPYSWMDQSVWVPIVESRGFIEVSQCYNSNSSNVIHVYHLVNDKKGRV